jgi:hypothetical protein
MSKLEVFDGLFMNELLDFIEIYPGDKTAHFEQIKEDSGVPFEQVCYNFFYMLMLYCTVLYALWCLVLSILLKTTAAEVYTVQL